MVQISTSLRNSAEALKARATEPSYTKKNNRFDAAVSKDMGRFKTVLTSHFKADGIKPAQLGGLKSRYGKLHQQLCDHKCITPSGFISLSNIDTLLSTD